MLYIFFGAANHENLRFHLINISISFCFNNICFPLCSGNQTVSPLRGVKPEHSSKKVFISLNHSIVNYRDYY